MHVATEASDRHLLLIDLPALSADSGSLDVLARALAAEYGETPSADADGETLQYADFAAWHTQSLDETAADARDYWRQQWTRETVRLPGIASEPARGAFTPQDVSIDLAPALVARLADIAASHGCAADVAVLAAWYTLLWRLGQQDEVVVGVTGDGRGLPQLAGAIGLFAACVPMKQRLRRGIAFAGVLDRIGQTLPDVEAWQPTFAWERQDPADGAPAAGFLAFAFERVAPAETCVAAGAEFTIVARDVLLDRFELKLQCAIGGDTPSLTLDYDAAVCSEATAIHLLALLAELLASAAADPSRPIERLNLVGAAERRQLVEGWNDTAAPIPDGCMHELFAAQAAKTPASVAAVCGDRSVTYQELDAQSTRQARRLRAHGVGPDAIVAVCAERSIELLAGLLGVLKAGGAYLPLDPSYPAKRLAFMLEDSGARVLLVDAATAPVLADAKATVIRLDADDAADGEEEHDLASVPTPRPENLAYVIYTSGSTGTPKGTLVPHRGLVNYVRWCQTAYPVWGGSGALVHSSISFDLTITGLLAPLVAGGIVRLLADGCGADALGAALSRERDLSLVKLTPSHLRIIDQQIEARDLGGRAQALVIGGENLTAEHLAAWRAHAPATRLFNEYGPTETVVGCCVYEIDARTKGAGSMPIGRPIANTALYVLDAALQLAPIGVPGELYIGGAGVARGYLHRAALTASRFVADPFAAEPGARLYRTGDLVQYDADGTLLYLGRIDHQVKIRGMRIELQEIEAVLGQHADVRASAVVPWGRGADDTRLVAYIVPRDGAADDRAAFVDAVKAFVQQALPVHMAPASYVVMKALPLTANGKVNRDALPDPDRDGSAVRPPYVAPRTDAERLLAEVWQQALNAGRIGIDDDFFALGGNSLLCFQIIHKLHQAGHRLTLHQIFAHQSIRALAPVLEAGASGAAVRHEPVVGPAPLTPIQHWFFEQPLASHDRFTQSVVLDVAQRLDPALLLQALAQVVAHHDAFRARFVRDEHGWRQEILADAVIPPIDVIVCEGATAEETRVALDRGARAIRDSLSLGSGPLVKLAIVDAGDAARTRLLVACHHIAIDAVSWRILIEDLYAAYEQLRQGAPVRLLPTTPFGRWAQRLDEWAAGQALAAEAAHWIADDAIAPLPRDRHDGANVASSTAAVTVALTEEETRALVHDLPQAFGTRINDALLTAVAGAIRAWTNAATVLIDLEGHGRDAAVPDVDLSRTIGWFTTLHPVRLSPAGSGVDALRAVSAHLQRIPNGGFGYGALRYLGRDAALANRLRRQPQAEIVFNYVGVVDAPLSGAGVGVTAEQQSAGIDGASPRSHLLDLVGEISGGCLRLHWAYSRHLHDAATIERVAQDAIGTLRSLVADAARAQKPAAAAIDGQQAGAGRSLAEKVLVGLQPHGSGRPLFLAHPSGGMSTVYVDAIAALGTSRPVYGFQSKGWYPGEEPDTDLVAMTASYVDVMRAVQPAGPYLLAGWSAGGIVAFEMARQLRSRGASVAFLGIIDQPPPQPDAVWQTDEMLLESMLGHHLPGFAARVAGMTPEARLEYGLEQAKALRFVPENSDLAQARRLLHVFRVTQIAVRAYVPAIFDGSAVLFRAEEQPAGAFANDPTFGWDQYVTGNVQVHQVPGHHQNLLEEPHARVLGERLRSSLELAEASHVPGHDPAA